MTDSPTDVVIVGGGVIGLACAHALLKAGRAVTVLERERVGSGASHGNCGTITPSVLPLPAPGVISKALKWLWRGDAPLRIRLRMDADLLRWMYTFARHCNRRNFQQAARARAELLLASRKLLADLVHSERLDCELVENGVLYVHRDPRELELAEGDVRILADLGISAEVLDGARARAKEPTLNDSIVGGHFFPRDASVRPDRFLAELARIVRAAGGVILEQSPVCGLRADSEGVTTVSTPTAEFAAREVVLTLGAWSPRLAKQLALRVPIQPGKGYSITYDRPVVAPVAPLYLKERAICVTPYRDSVRLGSTMEFAGYDRSLNRTRLDALTRGAHEYLRLLPGSAVREEWFGWRPMTPDDLPVLGRVPRFRNVTLATGHGMLGLTLAPVTGLLVSEILADRAPSLNLAPFSPERFQ